MSHPSREPRLRSAIKGITWRIIGTLDTLLLSWFFTGSFSIAAAIGGTEVVTKILLYYGHERVWQRIPIGAVNRVGRFFGQRPDDSDSNGTP